MNWQFRVRLRLRVSETTSVVASSAVTQPGAEAVKLLKLLGELAAEGDVGPAARVDQQAHRRSTTPTAICAGRARTSAICGRSRRRRQGQPEPP